MANPDIPIKAAGDPIYHGEVNQVTRCFPTKVDGCKKPFPIPFPGSESPLIINHGFGAILGLSAGQMYITVRLQDSIGADVSATISHVTANQASVIFDDSEGPLIGCAVVEVAPY